MNKAEFLCELERALRSARVIEPEDVLSEYSEHFDRKLSDGFSEEEIAARLASPRELAAQFAGGGHTARGQRTLITTGLVLLDIPVCMVFALLYAWVIVVAALALCTAAAGVALISGAFIETVVPNIPFTCRLIMGLDSIALASLATVGTAYSLFYVNQLVRVYFHWHADKRAGRISPPMPLYPQLGGKLRRRLRSVALVSLALFGALFIVGFISMSLTAGAFEFWHVWGWFRYAG